VVLPELEEPLEPELEELVGVEVVSPATHFREKAERPATRARRNRGEDRRICMRDGGLGFGCFSPSRGLPVNMPDPCQDTQIQT